jgi:hypothetical protein
MLTCLFRWLRSVTPIYRFSSSPLGFFFQQLCIPSTSVLIHCRFRESLVTCELARSNGQPYCAGHLGYCWPPGIIRGTLSDNVSATHKLEKSSLTDDTRHLRQWEDHKSHQLRTYRRTLSVLLDRGPTSNSVDSRRDWQETSDFSSLGHASRGLVATTWYYCTCTEAGGESANKKGDNHRF